MPRAGAADDGQQRLSAGTHTHAARAAATARPFTPALSIEAMRTGQRGSNVDRDGNRYRYRDRDRSEAQETGARHSHLRIDGQSGAVTRAQTRARARQQTNEQPQLRPPGHVHRTRIDTPQPQMQYPGRPSPRLSRTREQPPHQRLGLQHVQEDPHQRRGLQHVQEDHHEQEGINPHVSLRAAAQLDRVHDPMIFPTEPTTRCISGSVVSDGPCGGGDTSYEEGVAAFRRSERPRDQVTNLPQSEELSARDSRLIPDSDPSLMPIPGLCHKFNPGDQRVNGLGPIVSLAPGCTDVKVSQPENVNTLGSEGHSGRDVSQGQALEAAPKDSADAIATGLDASIEFSFDGHPQRLTVRQWNAMNEWRNSRSETPTNKGSTETVADAPQAARQGQALEVATMDNATAKGQSRDMTPAEQNAGSTGQALEVAPRAASQRQAPVVAQPDINDTTESIDLGTILGSFVFTPTATPQDETPAIAQERDTSRDSPDVIRTTAKSTIPPPHITKPVPITEQAIVEDKPECSPDRSGNGLQQQQQQGTRDAIVNAIQLIFPDSAETIAANIVDDADHHNFYELLNGPDLSKLVSLAIKYSNEMNKDQEKQKEITMMVLKLQRTEPTWAQCCSFADVIREEYSPLSHETEAYLSKIIGEIRTDEIVFNEVAQQEAASQSKSEQSSQSSVQFSDPSGSFSDEDEDKEQSNWMNATPKKEESFVSALEPRYSDPGPIYYTDEHEFDESTVPEKIQTDVKSDSGQSSSTDSSDMDSSIDSATTRAAELGQQLQAAEDRHCEARKNTSRELQLASIIMDIYDPISMQNANELASHIFHNSTKSDIDLILEEPEQHYELLHAGQKKFMKNRNDEILKQKADRRAAKRKQKRQRKQTKAFLLTNPTKEKTTEWLDKSNREHPLDMLHIAAMIYEYENPQQHSQSSDEDSDDEQAKPVKPSNISHDAWQMMQRGEIDVYQALALSVNTATLPTASEPEPAAKSIATPVATTTANAATPVATTVATATAWSIQDFEKADTYRNYPWFERNWEEHGPKMRQHAQMVIYDMSIFKNWYKANKCGSATGTETSPVHTSPSSPKSHSQTEEHASQQDAQQQFDEALSSVAKQFNFSNAIKFGFHNGQCKSTTKICDVLHDFFNPQGHAEPTDLEMELMEERITQLPTEQQEEVSRYYTWAKENFGPHSEIHRVMEKHAKRTMSTVAADSLTTESVKCDINSAGKTVQQISSAVYAIVDGIDPRSPKHEQLQQLNELEERIMQLPIEQAVEILGYYEVTAHETQEFLRNEGTQYAGNAPQKLQPIMVHSFLRNKLWIQVRKVERQHPCNTFNTDNITDQLMNSDNNDLITRLISDIDHLELMVTKCKQDIEETKEKEYNDRVGTTLQACGMKCERNGQCVHGELHECNVHHKDRNYADTWAYDDDLSKTSIRQFQDALYSFAMSNPSNLDCRIMEQKVVQQMAADKYASVLRQDFIAAIEDVNAHRKQPAEKCEESPHSKSKAFVFGPTFTEQEQPYEEKIINDTRTVIISTVTRTEDHDGVYNNAVLLEARLKAPKYQLAHKLAVPGASFPIPDSEEGYKWHPVEGYDRSYGSTQEWDKDAYEQTAAGIFYEATKHYVAPANWEIVGKTTSNEHQPDGSITPTEFIIFHHHIPDILKFEGSEVTEPIRTRWSKQHDSFIQSMSPSDIFKSNRCSRRVMNAHMDNETYTGQTKPKHSFVEWKRLGGVSGHEEMRMWAWDEHVVTHNIRWVQLAQQNIPNVILLLEKQLSTPSNSEQSEVDTTLDLDDSRAQSCVDSYESEVPSPPTRSLFEPTMQAYRHGQLFKTYGDSESKRYNAEFDIEDWNKRTRQIIDERVRNYMEAMKIVPIDSDQFDEMANSAVLKFMEMHPTLLCEVVSTTNLFMDTVNQAITDSKYWWTNETTSTAEVGMSRVFRHNQEVIVQGQPVEQCQAQPEEDMRCMQQDGKQFVSMFSHTSMGQHHNYAHLSPAQRQYTAGCEIHALIQHQYGDKTGTVTGMLLEMDFENDIVPMLIEPEQTKLYEEAARAYEVLIGHQKDKLAFAAKAAKEQQPIKDSVTGDSKTVQAKDPKCDTKSKSDKPETTDASKELRVPISVLRKAQDKNVQLKATHKTQQAKVRARLEVCKTNSKTAETTITQLNKHIAMLDKSKETMSIALSKEIDELKQDKKTNDRNVADSKRKDEIIYTMQEDDAKQSDVIAILRQQLSAARAQRDKFKTKAKTNAEETNEIRTAYDTMQVLEKTARTLSDTEKDRMFTVGYETCMTQVDQEREMQLIELDDLNAKSKAMESTIRSYLGQIVELKQTISSITRVQTPERMQPRLMPCCIPSPKAEPQQQREPQHQREETATQPEPELTPREGQSPVSTIDFNSSSTSAFSVSKEGDHAVNESIAENRELRTQILNMSAQLTNAKSELEQGMQMQHGECSIVDTESQGKARDLYHKAMSQMEDVYSTHTACIEKCERDSLVIRNLKLKVRPLYDGMTPEEAAAIIDDEVRRGVEPNDPDKDLKARIAAMESAMAIAKAAQPDLDKTLRKIIETNYTISESTVNKTGFTGISKEGVVHGFNKSLANSGNTNIHVATEFGRQIDLWCNHYTSSLLPLIPGLLLMKTRFMYRINDNDLAMASKTHTDADGELLCKYPHTYKRFKAVSASLYNTLSLIDQSLVKTTQCKRVDGLDPQNSFSTMGKEGCGFMVCLWFMNFHREYDQTHVEALQKTAYGIPSKMASKTIPEFLTHARSVMDMCEHFNVSLNHSKTILPIVITLENSANLQSVAKEVAKHKIAPKGIDKFNSLKQMRQMLNDIESTYRSTRLQKTDTKIQINKSFLAEMSIKDEWVQHDKLVLKCNIYPKSGATGSMENMSMQQAMDGTMNILQVRNRTVLPEATRFKDQHKMGAAGSTYCQDFGVFWDQKGNKDARYIAKQQAYEGVDPYERSTLTTDVCNQHECDKHLTPHEACRPVPLCSTCQASLKHVWIQGKEVPTIALKNGCTALWTMSPRAKQNFETQQEKKSKAENKKATAAEKAKRNTQSQKDKLAFAAKTAKEAEKESAKEGANPGET